MTKSKAINEPWSQALCGNDLSHPKYLMLIPSFCWSVSRWWSWTTFGSGEHVACDKGFGGSAWILPWKSPPTMIFFRFVSLHTSYFAIPFSKCLQYIEGPSARYARIVKMRCNDGEGECISENLSTSIFFHPAGRLNMELDHLPKENYPKYLQKNGSWRYAMIFELNICLEHDRYSCFALHDLIGGLSCKSWMLRCNFFSGRGRGSSYVILGWWRSDFIGTTVSRCSIVVDIENTSKMTRPVGI